MVDPLVEMFAEMIHENWIYWTQKVAEQNPDLPKALVEKWKRSQVPYSKLPEESKEYDRIHARKMIARLRQERFFD